MTLPALVGEGKPQILSEIYRMPFDTFNTEALNSPMTISG